MLRIGRIDYANCTPIFQAMQDLYPGETYRYVAGVPARLNALLLSGEIDVCPSSSIELALHPKRYFVIPELSISSSGPVQSVLLFSTVPIEELDGRTVMLSSESATSVNLLKILLNMRYGCNCTFQRTTMDLDGALQEAPAVLLIGDAALRSINPASDLMVYDLGELWFQWTGLPFVFALWLTTREASVNHIDAVRLLMRQLRHAKDYARGHLERIADASPEALWMGRDRLLEYWRVNISYDLGDEQRKGLALFFRYAAELGLIDDVPELSFL